MTDTERKPLWVLSNRVDDRVVLWERDAVHPTGEAFVGGAAPALVGRSGEIERLLRTGEIIEVPEPEEGPKKPLLVRATGDEPIPAMPGQIVRLGRKLDPELFGKADLNKIEKEQAALPAEIPVPVGVVIPPAEESERTRRRS